MIDRAGRDRLAECIHQLAAGVVTNHEFEDKGEFKSSDDAIRAVFWGGPWLLYDDFRNYRLRGKYRLTPAVRKEVARWVLFLKSDLPYEWPMSQPGILSVLRAVANLMTLGLIARRAQRKFERFGDITVWPFLRRADYEAALRRPPYLNGPSNYGMQPAAFGRG
jgi:hypothetical protein